MTQDVARSKEKLSSVSDPAALYRHHLPLAKQKEQCDCVTCL